jgi:hypothetical protein
VRDHERRIQNAAEMANDRLHLAIQQVRGMVEDTGSKLLLKPDLSLEDVPTSLLLRVILLQLFDESDLNTRKQALEKLIALKGLKSGRLGAGVVSAEKEASIEEILASLKVS